MDAVDVIVIGGGLVGSAIAYGLGRCGRRVTVLDGADDAFRAARGNFGLVWVQGKGAALPPYATWTRGSQTRWPALAAALREETGIDVQLRQPGGFHLCFSDAQMQQRATMLQALCDELGGDYPFAMLGHAELAAKLPGLGPRVVGASYSDMDGHVNPLKLLRALHAAAQRRGARFVAGQQVDAIEPAAGGYTVRTQTGRFDAPRVVIAAGLGSRALAAQVGLNVPVRPNRGEVLIGERVAPFLDYPTTYIRQTEEGTIQIGDSHEDVGFDDGVRADVLAAIAQHAVHAFPLLAQMKLVRAWGALRVMSSDGFPVYQESERCPGVFAATCHSGVTLAAAHVLRVAPWIAGGAAPAGIEPFSGARFERAQPSLQPVH